MNKELKVEFKVKEWYKKFCKKYKLEEDTFDIDAELDRSLTIEENKDIIRTKLDALIDPVLLLTKEEVRALKDKEDALMKETEEKVIAGWIKGKSREVIKTDKINLLHHYLKMVVEGFNNSLILHGRAGLGKTYSTLNILKELKSEFAYKSGYTTPLGLYKWLYEHKDSVVVLDDLEGLMTNKDAIALLKTALWESNGKRFVSYETTSKLMEGVPSLFEFEGRIIILTNDINENNTNESYKALLSRAVNFELKFSHKEILEISEKILGSRKLSKAVVNKVNEIMKKDVNEISEFNLRLLDRLIKMVEYNKDKARELFKASLSIDSEMDLILRLMKDNKFSVTEQTRLFQNETGKGRATYFRVKKRVMELIK